MFNPVQSVLGKINIAEALDYISTGRLNVEIPPETRMNC